MKSIAILIAFLLPLGLPAQATVARGAGVPKKVAKGAHWYLDTQHHTAWTDLDLEWTELGLLGVKDMYPAGTMIVVQSDLGYSLLGPYAEYIWAAPHLRLTDSLVMAWDSVATMIFLLNGRQLHPENGFDARCWNVDGPPATVQGMPAHCLPDFQAAHDSVSCDSVRAWGMFGHNGHWLVPPQYDAPFQFENGVAEVVYDGQKRKINERGEFVD